MTTSSIIGIIVIAVIIVVLILYYKFKVPKSGDKDEAAEFIDSLADTFTDIIAEIINEIDITTYTDIDSFISDIYQKTYDKCWEFVESKIQELSGTSLLGTLAAKCINRENVETVINNILTSSFATTIEQKYVSRWEETTEQSLTEDAEAQETADLYEAELMEVEEAEELVEEVGDIELNPQTDDEGGYDPEDISQEIVGEITESDEIADSSVQDLLLTLTEDGQSSEEE